MDWWARLDCPLEFKKGESQTNIEITKEEDWNKILQAEEVRGWIRRPCVCDCLSVFLVGAGLTGNDVGDSKGSQ